ncbi:hypothetical protein M3Y97_00012600 [Aphelenchoides bicaudatus]|nr:hypothetical protein M3Y97_00012600 [Aphelenchoides bicaudatus]
MKRRLQISLLLLSCLASEAILPTNFMPRNVGNLVCYRRAPQSESVFSFLFNIVVCERDVQFCGRIVESRFNDQVQMNDVDRKLTCYEAKRYCTQNGLVENEFYLLECCDRNLCN